jgi:hypothetical protein
MSIDGIDPYRRPKAASETRVTPASSLLNDRNVMLGLDTGRSDAVNGRVINSRSIFEHDLPASIDLLPAQALLPEEVLIITDGVGTTMRIDGGEVLITEEGSFIGHLLSAG